MYTIYGHSYHKYSVVEIVDRLLITTGRLCRSLRKEPENVPARFSHCVAWAFAAASNFKIDVGDSLHHKYWVQKKESRRFSASQWQKVLSKRFKGSNIKAGGLYFCTTRLFEETAETLEIVSALGEIDLDDSNSEAVYLSYRGEIADLFGWLFAISDMLDIDLEATVSEYYKNGCRHQDCKGIPCTCPLEHYIDRKRVRADTMVIP